MFRFLFGRKSKGRKSISPEAKSKAQVAKTEAYLANVWLKMLKQSPELAQRIAEQKFGVEVTVSGDSEGGQPDLLETLRTAREAKNLIRTELGEGKGSMIKDLAEIIKVLPDVLRGLQSQQAQAIRTFVVSVDGEPREVSEGEYAKLMQSGKLQPVAQLSEAELPEQTKPEEKQPEPVKLEARMEAILPLLELSPSEAYQELQNRGEKGWINYLKGHSSEELLSNLQGLTKDPKYGQFVTEFLQEKSDWFVELVQIAQETEEK